IDMAVDAARGAYEKWRLTPAPKRGEILFKAAEILREGKPDLGRLVTREMGKVVKEGLGDVQEAIDMAYYMAGEGRRMSGETMPSELKDKDCKTVREPIGVFALITPWNFPVAIPSWKIFPALISGNTVILKPSSLTPVVAARFVEALQTAGLPPGVLNLVHGKGEDAGTCLASHPGIDGISFTGSNPVGEGLIRACSAGGRGKEVSCEMGGKNPVIIMDDADLALAVKGCLWGGFGTTGQRCTAASRVIVHKKAYKKFIKMFKEAAVRLKLGNGLFHDTDVGPVVSRHQMQKVLGYIRLGKDEGATLLVGGNRRTDGEFKKGFFIEPTIFVDVDPAMRIAREEIFGPVVAVIKTDGLEHAIDMANDADYGLSSSIYTSAVNKSAVAERDLLSGIVYINAPTIGAEVHLPFGGIKRSGTGRKEAGGRGGSLDIYTRWKVIYRDFSGSLQKAQIQ
ncbi:MAG: aldehyde dehydrogenase family protein, partial [Deltaproteobacteria bacterium]